MTPELAALLTPENLERVRKHQAEHPEELAENERLFREAMRESEPT